MPELLITEDTTPAQIVAVLHAEIAAKSPEHAELVAGFEQITAAPRRGYVEPRPCSGRVSPLRLRRLTVYSGSRLAGMTVKAAARRAGIARKTAGQYEADFLAAIGRGAL